MKLSGWWFGGGRPPRWFRLASAAIAVLFAVGLMNARELTDVFRGILGCSLMLLTAIAPKGLYDGRFKAWTPRHRILSGALVFLVLGGIFLFMLSDYIAPWLAAVCAFPLSAAFAAWSTYRERAASQNT
ncbi:hypothetical protein [Kribbella shirazensis]|uniref:4-hydroxybenzoate polyprenyltransferase n=1 Tax=Kribbella shirazensis TaxID=1105143 RepID=A0A7X5VBM0_9ACTN|nr:hypothetical protein [Kribbella shirazensis]NIK58209.1 4-hydroxybenzoate polyprenyltransferase [Kribbella shirazensis]